MAREAGIPLRFGFADPTVERFLTHPMDIRSAHYVQQNLELLVRSLSALGYRIPDDHQGAHGLRLNWPIEPQAATRAGKSLSDAVGQNDFFVIHPGAGAAVKQWPAQRWSAVANAVSIRSGARVVLTGTQDESRMCQSIVENSSTRLVNLAGQTSLFTLAEIFRDARAVLGVDSGPLHLASAVGTPTIALYGPSDVTRYGPWGDSSRHRVVRAGMHCPRCGDLSASRPEGCGCMMAITVDEVVRAAIEVLDYAG
jgi:ADP-heptose:LPS heptosyltransferase